MNRLKDFYNKEFQVQTGTGKYKVNFESYKQWLNRINVSEENDDLGTYGDENPTWIETPPLPTPNQ